MRTLRIGCAWLSVSVGLLLSACGTAALAQAPAAQPTATRSATTRPAAKAAKALPVRKDTTPLPTLKGAEGAGVLGQMLAYALVILVLGGGALLVMRRYFPRTRPSAGGKLRIVHSAYLGPRKQVHVLEAEGRRFLLASCRDSITMLSELTDPFSQVYRARGGGEDAMSRQADHTGREGAP